MKTKLLALSFFLPTLAFALPGLHGKLGGAVRLTNYQVPVPAELEKFSRFQMPVEIKQRGDGLTEVSYDLPATLVGQPMEFRFLGEVDYGAASFTLKDENAEMNCSLQNFEADCRVMHRKVNIDLVAAKAALELSGLPRREVEGRLKVAALLKASGGDMGGVMKYRLDFNGY